MTSPNPRPRKRFGQHFLEPAWIAKLVGVTKPCPTDHFLEIGPGRGAVTLALAPLVADLLAVEIDRELAARLAARAPANVTIKCADFLALDASFFAGIAPTTRVVGNLPYNVSSPILIRLLQVASTSGRLADATLMLQREVAERVVSPPGSKVYGTLSVFTALVADVVWLLDVPPGAFRPAPKVHSAVISLRFRAGAAPAPAGFAALVKGLFGHRRKTMPNALRSVHPELSPALVVELLGLAEIDPALRPERVPPQALLALSHVLGMR